MSEKDFFDEQTEQSEIKTEIVHKYFWIWAHIIAKHLRKKGNYNIGYVDLFAGRGRYKDESMSTPLLILETAIQHPEFSQTLVTFFNDKKRDNYKNLKKEIASFKDVEILKYTPIVENFEVDDDTVDWVKKNVKFPALFFLDPCGYKGLSLKLVKHVLSGFGCDCIFFFNYLRINQHLENPVMTSNMNAFFGKSRAEKLRTELTGKSRDERQDLIINNLKDALVQLGGTFNMEYCFTKNDGNRTSHFVIFTTKHPSGFSKMKEIMARKSSSFVEGVPSYKFNPAPTFFEVEATIEELIESLLDTFAGRSVSFQEIYYSHGKNTKFILENYQDALRRLEENKRVVVNPPADKRQKRESVVTFGPNVIVSFPKK